MRHARKKMAALAGIAALAAAVAAVPGVASADENACPSGFFCLWTDADYQGSIIMYAVGMEQALLDPPFHDAATSYRNNTNADFQIWEHAGYQGAYATVHPNAHGGNLSNEQLYNPQNGVSVNANDVVSSVRTW
ncbi:peptidase inhibitor family I36 protein [Actinoplanes sp. NPDC049548]|uniref:peptidase inhibitor family I36 protein n=1 Tax=Actinoplanes sp. NPDC049548 TaxID=3155152 RepID=UPI003420BD76